MIEEVTEFELSVKLTSGFSLSLSGSKDWYSDIWYAGASICKTSPNGWKADELVFFETEIDANTEQEAINALKKAVSEELEQWINLIKGDGNE